jgi:hypothetical protein
MVHRQASTKPPPRGRRWGFGFASFGDEGTGLGSSGSGSSTLAMFSASLSKLGLRTSSPREHKRGSPKPRYARESFYSSERGRRARTVNYFARRITCPGPAPLCLSYSTTGWPFTSTSRNPVAYWCGCLNVALSCTLAGSNTTRSAA